MLYKCVYCWVLKIIKYHPWWRDWCRRLKVLKIQKHLNYKSFGKGTMKKIYFRNLKAWPLCSIVFLERSVCKIIDLCLREYSKYNRVIDMTIKRQKKTSWEIKPVYMTFKRGISITREGDSGASRRWAIFRAEGNLGDCPGQLFNLSGDSTRARRSEMAFQGHTTHGRKRTPDLVYPSPQSFYFFNSACPCCFLFNMEESNNNIILE